MYSSERKTKTKVLLPPFSKEQAIGDTSSTSSALSTGMDRRCVSVRDEATTAAGLVHAGGADGDALFGFEDAL